MRWVVFLLATHAIAGDFATSLGDVYPYAIRAITTDSAGDTYVVGNRQLISSSRTDVFVSKLDPYGQLLFTNTFGGSGTDAGLGVALDPSGNIYISGNTTSPDFPLLNALQKQINPAYGTGFIIKLSNDGSTVLYSTYFGGTNGGTSISSLATDSKGNLYFTGNTQADDFPRVGGLPLVPVHSSFLLFMGSISAAGDKILYSGSFFGSGGVSGSGPIAGGVAVDAAGNAYFAGGVGNSNLPTTPGAFSSLEGGGFVTKVNPTGTGFVYSTFVPSFVYGIAIDSEGNAYLAGYFPISRASELPNGYVAKLNPTGSAILWTNDFGQQASTAKSIAVDPSGNVWVTGTAYFSTLPNQGWSTGTEFLVGLNASGSQRTYSALYPYGTVQQSIALDSSGRLHVAGWDGFVSVMNPIAPTMEIFFFENAFDGSFEWGGVATARISPAEVISIYGPGIGPPTAATASPVNGFYPKTFAGVQVTINGIDMPLLYVSANQINAVVPMGLATGAAATVRVINGTTVSAGYPVWILESAPLAFPTVLNQDGTINSQTNPAQSGSIITFYATGFQSNFYPLADGQVATSALNPCFDGCSASALGISSATVLYGGAAPGIVAGVTQFNVLLGSSASAGSAEARLSISGPATLEQIVWIAP